MTPPKILILYTQSLQYIGKSTRDTDSWATLIDPIYTKNHAINDTLYQDVWFMDMSDHMG